MEPIDTSFFTAERAADLSVVGESVERADARGHVTGRTQFYEDVTFPNTLHLKMVRSTRHHARLKKIDVEPALQVPGVVRVLTHKDVPNNWYTVLCLIGVEPADEPVLAEEKVRFKGEQICAVLAETPQAAMEGARRVVVEYEDLPAVFDVEEAMTSEPFTSHGTNYFVYEGHNCRRIRFGDVGKGFAGADHIIEHRYDSAPIEHAPTEPTGCTAKPEGNGRIIVYSNTQALYFTLDNMALILGIPFNRLRLVGGTVGGGFGGKVDVIVEPIAALGAILTNRPVKYAYSRAEEMQVSSPRASERLYIKDGVMKDGRIVARQIRLYVDAGAYCRHTTYGTTKAAAHMPGPYSIPNVHVDAYCVYTNRTPSSAMRGFGVTIGDFALESQMDQVARFLHMDPMELRLINAYRDGDTKAHRKTVEGAALVEVIQAAAKRTGKTLEPRFRKMSSLTREA